MGKKTTEMFDFVVRIYWSVNADPKEIFEIF